MTSTSRAGGGPADVPIDSDGAGGPEQRALTGPSGSTAASGADGASRSSRVAAGESGVQRRRPAELGREAGHSSAGEERLSSQSHPGDSRQRGSSPQRRHRDGDGDGDGDRSPAVAAGSPPPVSPRPPAVTAVKSETAPGPASSPEPEPEDQLTHLELETVYRDTLAGLLASDPLLSDLPASLTAAELRSLTALEHGTAMAVLVNRGDRLTRVIVQRSATVRDLKVALRSAVELEVGRRGGRRRAIGWRHVWRTNWLAFGSCRLKDDNAALSELGIGNKAEVRFVKRIRPKRGQRDKKGGQV